MVLTTVHVFTWITWLNFKPIILEWRHCSVIVSNVDNLIAQKVSKMVCEWLQLIVTSRKLIFLCRTKLLGTFSPTLITRSDRMSLLGRLRLLFSYQFYQDVSISIKVRIRVGVYRWQLETECCHHFRTLKVSGPVQSMYPSPQSGGNTYQSHVSKTTSRVIHMNRLSMVVTRSSLCKFVVRWSLLEALFEWFWSDFRPWLKTTFNFGDFFSPEMGFQFWTF